MADKQQLNLQKKRKADKLVQENRLEEAKALFFKVCQSDRHDSEAWVKLGLVNRKLALYREAVRCCRQAVLLQPTLSFAHYALGSSLQCLGELAEAISCYSKAIELMPELADAHYLLGTALDQTGDRRGAIDSYRQALQIRPRFFEALSDLGALLIETACFDEAAEVLHRAMEIKPHSAAVQVNLTSALQALKKTNEAVKLAEWTLRVNPESADAIAVLADLRERTGCISEANALVAKGLASSAGHVVLNLVSARLARRENRWDEAAEILERQRRQPMPPTAAGEVLTMLGQSYDQLGATEKVFPLLTEGNRLTASSWPTLGLDRKRYHHKIEKLSGYASPALGCCTPYDPPPAQKAPVFLIGFPRSGTTLLEQILDSHPALQSMEETGAVSLMVDALFRMNGSSDALAALSQQEVQQLRDLYFNEVARHLQPRPDAILIDKLPLNIVAVPVIWRAFQSSKMILAVRHPCDVCLSCFMHNFALNEAMAAFVGLDHTVALYTKVMSAWQKYSEVLPLNFHIVRYEDLLTDLQAEARGMLEFLGVQWDEAVLHHVEHARKKGAINTPSYYQVAQPVYQHAKYRWHRYGHEFAPYMEQLQPFIDLFGYGEADARVRTG